MAAELRKLEPGEEPAFVKSVRVPFLDPNTGSAEDEEADKPRAARIETSRMWVVEESGRFVGNCGVRTMDLTVPAATTGPCPVLPMGGVTAVGVHPTHRRQGHLTKMMDAMLTDCRDRGEPVAGLIASESVIYGRYGFGLASDSVEYRIDSARSAFTAPVADVGLHLIDHAEAHKVLPALFERARTARAGEPSRSPQFWEDTLADPPGERHGMSGMMFVVCDDGYAAYRAALEADMLRAERADIVVEEVTAATPEVNAALWRFVLDLDLIGTVTFRRRAVDEPVRWRLRDPRQLQVTKLYDRLYLRLLDVPAALEGRGYQSQGRVVLEVLPAESPGTSADPAVGTWVLEAGPDGASCRRAASGDRSDLRLRVTDLGSLYLGGFKASTLAAAGRLEESGPGGLATADRLFGAALAPLTVTGF